MDRLDTWLNAQRGWRRLVLLWLQTYPAAMLIVDGYLAWRNQSGYGWLFALAVPCAAVLGGLVLLSRAGSERRARRSGRFLQPLFSWRGAGFLLLFASSMALGIIVDSHGYEWKQRHHALADIMLAFALAGCGLAFENFRYVRHMRRTAGPSAT